MGRWYLNGEERGVRREGEDDHHHEGYTEGAISYPYPEITSEANNRRHRNPNPSLGSSLSLIP